MFGLGTKIIRRVVKTAFYVFRGTFWGFKKNVNMFTPNRQFPEKKNQPTEGMIFLAYYITMENNKPGIAQSGHLRGAHSKWVSLYRTNEILGRS